MINNTITVKGKPRSVAKKALALMKRSRPKEANLARFDLIDEGARIVAIARSEKGFFHNSEVRAEVEMRSGVTIVHLTANDDKTEALIDRLRRSL
jgi:hypothetical protein